ncbi:MAG: hypothetical protein ACYC2H_07550 [Thermoplasmatota archaeon]
MMILAAVLLVIGLIALAGMVARVNQLGSQTTVEADKVLLRDVSPVNEVIDSSICRIIIRPTLPTPDCGPATLRHFNLTETSYIRAEDAVKAMLEQVQRVEASHGIWMDYVITCDGADAAKGLVIAHLSDGTIWVEVRSSVYFPRASCASDVTG